MTCIAGLEKNGMLYFGGDSICVSSYTKTINPDSKVFQREGLLFGTTGPPRLRNVLQYRLEIPACAASQDPMTYLMNDFLEALHACFQKDGFEQEDRGRRFFEGRILLGLRSELYIVGGEYHIGRPSGSYCAIGVGEEYAYGSLHTTEQMNIDPLQRLTLALEAAAYHNTDVAGPFTFVTSEETA
jgi:hypothetical protein